MNQKRAYYAQHRIRFEFRRSQVGSPVGTIYAIIYVEGQKPEAKTTSIRATRETWDALMNPKRCALAKNLNEQLVYWEDTLRSAAYALRDRGEPITAAALIDEKNYANQPLLTLESLYTLFLAHKKSLIGPREATRRMPHQIAPDTYVTYARRWAWVSRFLAHKKQSKLLAVKVDAPLVQNFYYYLSTQNIGAAYATKCVKLLTEVCQWAYKAGHIRELKTGGFRGTAVAESAPYNLTEEEVCRLEALELSRSQARIRDGWLLARELCLHYGDYIDLMDRHFSRDDKGRLIFDKPRVKQESGRNIRMASFVSERAERLWLRYNRRPPVRCSNANMSRVLGEIGQQAGLAQKLKFSHARDSGIFRLVTLGRSEFEIKLAAGWTSMRQLVKYVNHDRLALEQLTAPAYVRSSPESSLPFTNIYKAS